MQTSHNSTLNNVYESSTPTSKAEKERIANYKMTEEQWRMHFSILFSTMTVRTLIYVVAIFLPLYVNE